MGRKVTYFGGYKFWGPASPDFEYEASGDASDYMYGVLGVDSFGFEIGNGFKEECDNFEEQVMPNNLPALIYAAKPAKKPLSLVKGPDITQFEITAGTLEDVFAAFVVASDSLKVNGHANGGHTTGDQGFARIQIFLDVHLNDYESGNITWETQSVGNDPEKFEATISLGVQDGRHTIFAQAMDNDGYSGPISGIFVGVSRID